MLAPCPRCLLLPSSGNVSFVCSPVALSLFSLKASTARPFLGPGGPGGGKSQPSRLAPDPPSHRPGERLMGPIRTSGDWCLGCSPRPLGQPGNVTIVGKESSAYRGFVFK